MSTKQVENRQSRSEYKQAQKRSVRTISGQARKQQRAQKKESQRVNKVPRRRVFPIWFRIIVLLILCVLALAGGLMVGYGVLGDGAPKDALKMETWQHIIDFVGKK